MMAATDGGDEHNEDLSLFCGRELLSLCCCCFEWHVAAAALRREPREAAATPACVSLSLSRSLIEMITILAP